MFSFTFSRRITSYFNGMNFHTFSSRFVIDLKSWQFFKLGIQTITENSGTSSSYLDESSNESLRRSICSKTLITKVRSNKNFSETWLCYTFLSVSCLGLLALSRLTNSEFEVGKWSVLDIFRTVVSIFKK